ncbi:MAG: hypothetical protein ACPLYX_11985, partial [Rectinema subterraneum]|uniref:hypothetical protein n=1 Tax=Rectinema subterraneum TaxID=2653714 RepID=UPI003C7CBA55
MAISNYERVGKTMELLRSGLAPFVEREVNSRMGPAEAERILWEFADRDRKLTGKPVEQWDIAA